jgi:pimeloyl-ACP methyl ester carboxylesterase
MLTGGDMKKRTLLLTCLMLAVVFCAVPSFAADAPKPAAPPAAAFSLPAAQLVRVGDIDISYRVLGDGHPLLLINGYSATMDQWDRTLLKTLSSRYKVILLDNRGIGKTTATEKPFTIELFAQDTVGLMDVLKIPKAHILGFSMGTFIATEIALRYPQRVGKLILYAGNCGWDGKDIVRPRPEDAAALTDLSGTREDRSKRLVSVLFPKKWLHDHPDFLKTLPDAESPVPLSIIERQGQAMKIWAGVCPKLGTVTQSTLIITGTEDVVIPPANSLMMTSRIPNSWLIRIPGGHLTMYQYPETFSRSVLTFLDAEQ